MFAGEALVISFRIPRLDEKQELLGPDSIVRREHDTPESWINQNKGDTDYQVLERDGWRCQCWRAQDLQVHHL